MARKQNCGGEEKEGLPGVPAALLLGVGDGQESAAMMWLAPALVLWWWRWGPAPVEPG